MATCVETEKLQTKWKNISKYNKGTHTIFKYADMKKKKSAVPERGKQKSWITPNKYRLEKSKRAVLKAVSMEDEHQERSYDER